jgi:hypothetical protein
MCRVDDPAEGGSGNPHPVGSAFLVKLFQISEAHRFELVEIEDDLTRLARR